MQVSPSCSDQFKLSLDSAKLVKGSPWESHVRFNTGCSITNTYTELLTPFQSFAHFFKDKRQLNSSLYTVNFYHFSRGNSLAPDLAPVFQGQSQEKYTRVKNIIYYFGKKRNAKLKETLGLLLQFLWQRVPEAPAIPTALPPHRSLALQLYKSNTFPSYSLKLMLLRWWIRKTQFRGGIRSHSDHTRVQDKGWSWHWWQMQQRSVTPGHNYCPTFGSDRHRGLGWGLKHKDQIKESSLRILLTSPPCRAPKASQGFTVDDHEGIQSSSVQAVHSSAF